MMQRPVITGDAETIRLELTHKEHVYLVERADPQALATGIVELAHDPELRQRMVAAAFERVQENTIQATGATVKEVLESLAPVLTAHGQSLE